MPANQWIRKLAGGFAALTVAAMAIGCAPVIDDTEAEDNSTPQPVPTVAWPELAECISEGSHYLNQAAFALASKSQLIAAIGGACAGQVERSQPHIDSSTPADCVKRAGQAYWLNGYNMRPNNGQITPADTYAALACMPAPQREWREPTGRETSNAKTRGEERAWTR